jgi:hypothetical protein
MARSRAFSRHIVTCVCTCWGWDTLVAAHGLEPDEVWRDLVDGATPAERHREIELIMKEAQYVGDAGSPSTTRPHTIGRPI